jgi:hypothetical protein
MHLNPLWWMDVPPMLEGRNYRSLNSSLRPFARARRLSRHCREELFGREVHQRRDEKVRCLEPIGPRVTAFGTATQKACALTS